MPFLSNGYYISDMVFTGFALNHYNNTKYGRKGTKFGKRMGPIEPENKMNYLNNLYPQN